MGICTRYSATRRRFYCPYNPRTNPVQMPVQTWLYSPFRTTPENSLVWTGRTQIWTGRTQIPPGPIRVPFGQLARERRTFWVTYTPICWARTIQVTKPQKCCKDSLVFKVVFGIVIGTSRWVVTVVTVSGQPAGGRACVCGRGAVDRRARVSSHQRAPPH